MPIVKLLRIVDSYSKPTMGYVHDGMIRVSKAVKAICEDKVEQYKPYIDLINKRWDKHLSRDLFVASYFLNPAFKYANDFEDTRPIKNGILDLLENQSLCPDTNVVLEELTLYS
ncbi:unnamed protein product [Linum trigynum]|uniref:Uncharacterized protein n=1 Tax=Linum trigynum TaxID=586398 RepID=A0AAV2CLI1_9ROSI